MERFAFLWIAIWTSMICRYLQLNRNPYSPRIITKLLEETDIHYLLQHCLLYFRLVMLKRPVCPQSSAGSRSAHWRELDTRAKKGMCYQRSFVWSGFSYQNRKTYCIKQDSRMKSSQMLGYRDQGPGPWYELPYSWGPFTCRTVRLFQEKVTCSSQVAVRG